MMHNRTFKAYLLVLGLTLSSAGMTKDKVETPAGHLIEVSGRQLLVLKPSLDYVYGTWVAAVISKEAVPVHFRLSALIPRETTEVQPVEGLANGEWKLDEKGLWIEKEFGGGVNVISLVFRAAAKFGRQKLTFVAKSPVSELVVMSPTGMMNITGQDLVVTGSDVQDAQGYTVMTLKRSIAIGDTVTLDVDGVPEGRDRLWFVGSAFGLLMLGGAGVLAWRTRIKAFVLEV